MEENKASISMEGNEGQEAITANGNENTKSSEKNSEFDKNKDFQNKLRRFKISSSGKIAEYRKREAYDSPSVKRKKKSKEARRRNKKRNYSYNRRNGF